MKPYHAFLESVKGLGRVGGKGESLGRMGGMERVWREWEGGERGDSRRWEGGKV